MALFYSAKVISIFSENIMPFLKAISFPLSSKTLNVFNLLKSGMELASFRPIDEGIPLNLLLSVMLLRQHCRQL